MSELSRVSMVAMRNDNLATLTIDGAAYVAVKPISDAIGLNWRSQHRQLREDRVMAPKLRVEMVLLPGESQMRSMLLMPIGMVNGWLFRAPVSRAAPEVQERLYFYQAECFDVLDAYWRRGVAVNPRFRMIEDSVGVYDDQRLTQGQRFRKERLRIEQVYGLPFDKASGMSRKRIRMIEELDASLGTKAELYDRLLSIGMDLQYVRRGERTLTPAERAVRDTMRLAGPEERRMLIETTERLDCDKGIPTDPTDPADFAVDVATVERSQHARVMRKTRLH